MEFCETQLKDRRRKRLVKGSSLSPTKGSAIYWGEPRGKEENLGWFRIGRNKGIGVSYRFAPYSSKLAQEVRKPSEALGPQPSSVGRN